ncbi:MAG: sigma-54-dependent Fis family transcriptional regulator [Burkholderiales bacterium RIFOXYC12_FULL_65_23]|uniref:sigma-54-dependent Fis family transcriptional regulator n=1 Tax=Malikia spinosa TaxID=86180 RepID=UPI0008D4AFD1|nr:MAG: sigma-54-dependent Fis family transcriptional regulator [Burkholderiales bacterium RIFOXYC12_FULL_65_23]
MMETLRPELSAGGLTNGWPYSTEIAQRDTLIRQSHERSLQFGLSSRDRPDFSAVPQATLHEALEVNRFLYQHAAPVMETLYEQIANTHSMVLLTAKNGMILHSLGDSDFLAKASEVALRPGVEWSERSMGTNAIGTALTEEQPVVVHGRDHYLYANQSLTCSCTPIFDPHGKVVGALDVTGDERGYHSHTLALVRMSAQMVENQMFANLFADAVRIQFHSRPEFLGTLVEGIAVFSPDGRFLSANRSAQFQLGLSFNCLQAHTFSTLFGQSMSQFMDRLRSAVGKPLLLRLNSGVSVWCQTPYKSSKGWYGLGQHDAGADEPEGGAAGLRSRAAPAAVAAAPAPLKVSAKQGLSSLHFLDTGDAQVAAVVRKLQMVLDRDIPIMILGETGTGKDILAQAIHNDSRRAAKPFVSVNCASIPETLIESELFGYEEGAFTGARRKGSTGRILQANGGTLFLDEIGDMPTQLQARLLRVLQERRVNPLGSSKEYEVDVTIVCATHRNLKNLIAAGSFREDLYYRLNGIVVRLPALRDRTDFDTVVGKVLSSLCDGPVPAISDAVLALFRRYHWPGNFRQLHNVLRTAVALAGRHGPIGQDHLPDDFLDEMAAVAASPQPAALAPAPAAHEGLSAPLPGRPMGLADREPFSQQADPSATPAAGAPQGQPSVAPPQLQSLAANQRMQDVALQAMADALRRCGGNVSAAAKLLGVSRNTLYRKKDLLPPDCWV